MVVAFLVTFITESSLFKISHAKLILIGGNRSGGVKNL